MADDLAQQLLFAASAPPYSWGRKNCAMKIGLLGQSSYPHGDTSAQSSCKAVPARLAPSNPSGLRNYRW